MNFLDLEETTNWKNPDGIAEHLLETTMVPDSVADAETQIAVLESEIKIIQQDIQAGVDLSAEQVGIEDWSRSARAAKTLKIYQATLLKCWAAHENKRKKQVAKSQLLSAQEQLNKRFDKIGAKVDVGRQQLDEMRGRVKRQERLIVQLMTGIEALAAIVSYKQVGRTPHEGDCNSLKDALVAYREYRGKRAAQHTLDALTIIGDRHREEQEAQL